MSACGSAAEPDFRRCQRGNRIHTETSSVVVPRLGTSQAPNYRRCTGSRYLFSKQLLRVCTRITCGHLLVLRLGNGSLC